MFSISWKTKESLRTGSDNLDLFAAGDGDVCKAAGIEGPATVGPKVTEWLVRDEVVIAGTAFIRAGQSGIVGSCERVFPGDDQEGEGEGQSPLHLVLCLNFKHLKHLTGRELLLNFCLQCEQKVEEEIRLLVDPIKALTLVLIVVMANFLLLASLINLSFRRCSTNQEATGLLSGICAPPCTCIFAWV